MNKKLIILFFFTPLIAKDIYYTRSGIVSFFSSTPIEDIKAINEQTTCVLDMDNGDVSFRIPILGFNFKNGLMQEHFNENYKDKTLWGKHVQWIKQTLFLARTNSKQAVLLSNHVLKTNEDNNLNPQLLSYYTDFLIEKYKIS